ncbi:P-loop containing nucleoside triphosphate hydrolase protein [Spinellus fusiger]|nr:P-loop containing nucleoside triphosphate hydrolase protein [Spinellus fusiger]
MFIPRSIKRKFNEDRNSTTNNKCVDANKRRAVNVSSSQAEDVSTTAAAITDTATATTLVNESSSVVPNLVESPASIQTSRFTPTQPTLISTQPTLAIENSTIKAFSSEQRTVLPNSDEPICIVCGRYGEYINSHTEHDVCSLECKQMDIELSKAQHTQRKKSTSSNLKDIYAIPSPFYTAENLHAKLTHYQEMQEISTMSKGQRESILKAHEIQVKGDRVPHPIYSFDQCKALGSTLTYNLHQMGWSTATSIQRQAVPIGLAGRDIYAIAPTSAGKTGAFIIPILAHCQSLSAMHQYKRRSGPFALILAPTRELCHQIEQVTKSLSKGMRNTRTALLIGGEPLANHLYRLRKGTQIMIGTPGRVLEIAKEHPHLFRPWKLHMLVLDEADAMFSLGFGPQIRQILGKLPDTVKRQTSYYSATESDPKEIEKLCRRLVSPIEIRVSQLEEGGGVKAVPGTSNNVKQTVLWVENASKAKRLLSILSDPKYYAPPTLIFVDSRLGAEFLTRAIQKRNKQLRVIAMHSDKTQTERSAIVAGVNAPEPQWDVVVSTDVLSRGVDLPFVRLVINYDMAPTLEDYVHRIGRAVVHGPVVERARQQRGWAITFLNNASRYN